MRRVIISGRVIAVTSVRTAAALIGRRETHQRPKASMNHSGGLPPKPTIPRTRSSAQSQTVSPTPRQH
jgi:hypothetical protein